MFSKEDYQLIDRLTAIVDSNKRYKLVITSDRVELFRDGKFAESHKLGVKKEKLPTNLLQVGHDQNDPDFDPYDTSKDKVSKVKGLKKKVESKVYSPEEFIDIDTFLWWRDSSLFRENCGSTIDVHVSDSFIAIYSPSGKYLSSKRKIYQYDRDDNIISSRWQ